MVADKSHLWEPEDFYIDPNPKQFPGYIYKFSYTLGYGKFGLPDSAYYLKETDDAPAISYWLRGDRNVLVARSEHYQREFFEWGLYCTGQTLTESTDAPKYRKLRKLIRSS